MLEEQEVAVLKQKVTNLYANFEQNKLIATKCAKLTDIILKTQVSLDANIVQLNFHVSSE